MTGRPLSPGHSRATRVQAATELSRDLVLVGGGHSHVLALRMLAMQAIEGLRITLVSPDCHTPYSGMLPGLIAGHYSFEQAHIDLARLCQWAGVRFIAAQVTALDPLAQRLSLAGRPALAYDVVSIDIGSQPELDSVPGARAYATPVKPVAGLWRRWQELHGRVIARRSHRGIAHRGGGWRCRQCRVGSGDVTPPAGSAGGDGAVVCCPRYLADLQCPGAPRSAGGATAPEHSRALQRAGRGSRGRLPGAGRWHARRVRRVVLVYRCGGRALDRRQRVGDG